MTAMLIRSATPEDVRYAQRELDVLAVPYEAATAVRDLDGAAYVETIARGAFAGVADRARRIKVFRDHQPTRAVGKCLRIDGDAADGLRATLHIAPTALGDETLTLAAEGVLDVSVGMSANIGGEQWDRDRSRCRRTSCWLHELSLVPLPAYEEARVLAVRQQVAAVEPAPARSTTPNLDLVRDWLTDLRYGAPRHIQ